MRSTHAAHAVTVRAHEIALRDLDKDALPAHGQREPGDVPQLRAAVAMVVLHHGRMKALAAVRTRRRCFDGIKASSVLETPSLLPPLLVRASAMSLVVAHFTCPYALSSSHASEYDPVANAFSACSSSP